MKDPDRHRYSLDDLLSFPPVSVRVPGATGTGKLTVKDLRTKCLRKLPTGEEVPYPPGECVPLIDLTEDHVAVRYMVSRGYSLHTLDRMFQASYCTKEYPSSKETGIYYRRWEMGFNDTPQGRVVLFTSTGGVPVGWQSRLIDTVEEDGSYFVWHPYKNSWEKVGQYMDGRLHYLPAYETERRKLSKYRNATDMDSGGILFGHDAYVASNKEIPHSRRIIVLTEGPLDAARFPRNGVAYTRAYVSSAQARTAATLANTVVLAHDNDEAGMETLKKNTAILNEHCAKVVVLSPQPFKDFGEAGAKFASEKLKEALSR